MKTFLRSLVVGGLLVVGVVAVYVTATAKAHAVPAPKAGPTHCIPGVNC